MLPFTLGATVYWSDSIVLPLTSATVVDGLPITVPDGSCSSVVTLLPE
jgi:hypothetical protein